MLVHTLLYWILLMSRADWGIPGNLCLRMSKIVSALSSNCSLFSKLTAEPHGDLASLLCIFLLQMMIDASILFLRSRILCSVDKSIDDRNSSGSKTSTVILRYNESPRLALPFYHMNNKSISIQYSINWEKKKRYLALVVSYDGYRWTTMNKMLAIASMNM